MPNQLQIQTTSQLYQTVQTTISCLNHLLPSITDIYTKLCIIKILDQLWPFFSVKSPNFADFMDLLRVVEDDLGNFCDQRFAGKSGEKRTEFLQKQQQQSVKMKMCVGNGFGQVFVNDEDSLREVVKKMKTKCRIRRVKLVGSRRDSGVMKRFVKQVAGDRCLDMFDVAENTLRQEGSCVIENLLKTNVAIKYLNLLHNYIGDEGTVSLSRGLELNHEVLSINLLSNHIGDTGANALANMLKTNQTLEGLDLYGMF
mmetsp:Transcript_3512/g.3821  ORF Transcript_3512/g.3821 Transcript_3512/m.3821 type:complete len:256 (-) Transcript_3512:565-1332(-)